MFDCGTSRARCWIEKFKGENMDKKEIAKIIRKSRQLQKKTGVCLEVCYRLVLLEDGLKLLVNMHGHLLDAVGDFCKETIAKDKAA
jgi:hypothetical protein